ncbi:peroxidase-related enzyme [Oceanitalea stevensii]|uniref:Peroxidase-related enzyme n=1 Tax=Oceanitalea stevensii TaxID=2763072 RepID=A0ABR8Z4M5_9MICO|nr:peroxidase-related enzyme [Oceanitalea stevensii]MBD8063289.1 peroxidase-related enzyme [Oceanitalea stevensii]
MTATAHRPPTAREDVVGALAELDPATAEARLAKPEVVEHTQRAHDHLFTDPGRLSPALRRALAARVAEQHGAPGLAQEHHRHDPVDLAVATADESVAALVRHADLLSLAPALVTPDDVAALTAAGLDADGIVLLSQVVAVTAYEARLVTGLRLLAGHDDDGATPAPAADLPARAKYAPDLAPGGLPVPRAYTRELLGWLPWVEPIPTQELTDEHRAAFAGKSDGAYFRLLARETGVLAARTQIDHAVFLTRVGLPRAERELAAAVTSKVNDCIFCASVHARKAAQLSKRPADVDRLLAADVPRGPGWAPADLSALSAGQDERWAAVIDLAAALAASPSRATAGHVARLRELGLEPVELVDLVASVAFFSWANRLMLTLGEPHLPADSPATTAPTTPSGETR